MVYEQESFSAQNYGGIQYKAAAAPTSPRAIQCRYVISYSNKLVEHATTEEEARVVQCRHSARSPQHKRRRSQVRQRREDSTTQPSAVSIELKRTCLFRMFLHVHKQKRKGSAGR